MLTKEHIEIVYTKAGIPPLKIRRARLNDGWFVYHKCASSFGSGSGVASDWIPDDVDGLDMMRIALVQSRTRCNMPKFTAGELDKIISEAGINAEEFVYGEGGGMIYGKRHSECDDKGCGEKFVMELSGRNVEMEDREAVITGSAMQSQTVHTFTGTPEQILAEINSIYCKDDCRPFRKVEKVLGVEGVVKRPAMLDSKNVFTVTGNPRQIASTINEIYGGRNFRLNYPLAEVKVLMQEGGTVESLNKKGGYTYSGDAKETAKNVDLITLPEKVEGTNCSNCMYVKILDAKKGLGFCTNEKIRLPVTARMCCALWDSVDASRSWDKMNEGGGLNIYKYGYDEKVILFNRHPEPAEGIIIGRNKQGRIPKYDVKLIQEKITYKDVLEEDLTKKPSVQDEIHDSLSGMEMAEGGDLEKVKLKYAKQDIALLEKSGAMSIVDTKYGVLNLSLSDGIYSIHKNNGEKVFEGDKKGAIEFVKNAYQVEQMNEGGSIESSIDKKIIAKNWWNHTLSINEQNDFAKKHLLNFQISALVGSTSHYASADHHDNLIVEIWEKEGSPKWSEWLYKRYGLGDLSDKELGNKIYELKETKMAGGGDLSVAEEIRNNIGHKALYMLGAYNLAADKDSLSFRIKGSQKVNYIKITHNARDLYDIEYGKILRSPDPLKALSMTDEEYREKTYRVVKKETDIGIENLHQSIEQNTGLYTKLKDGGTMNNGKSKDRFIVELKAIHDTLWDFSNAGDFDEVFEQTRQIYQEVSGKKSKIENDGTWDSFNKIWKEIMPLAEKMTEKQIAGFYKEGKSGYYFDEMLEEVDLSKYEDANYEMFGKDEKMNNGGSFDWMDKELLKAGFDPKSFTEQQKYLILEPSEAPENYYMDGEVSPQEAYQFWKEKMKKSGLTVAQIKKAEEYNFGKMNDGGDTAVEKTFDEEYQDAVRIFGIEVNPSYKYQNIAKNFLIELMNLETDTHGNPLDRLKAFKVKLLTNAIDGEKEKFEKAIEDYDSEVGMIRSTRVVSSIGRKIALGDEMRALDNQPFYKSTDVIYNRLREMFQFKKFNDGGSIDFDMEKGTLSFNHNIGYCIEDFEKTGLGFKKIGDYQVDLAGFTFERINFLDSRYYLKK